MTEISKENRVTLNGRGTSTTPLKSIVDRDIMVKKASDYLNENPNETSYNIDEKRRLIRIVNHAADPPPNEVHRFPNGKGDFYGVMKIF